MTPRPILRWYRPRRLKTVWRIVFYGLAGWAVVAAAYPTATPGVLALSAALVNSFGDDSKADPPATWTAVLTISADQSLPILSA